MLFRSLPLESNISNIFLSIPVGRRGLSTKNSVSKAQFDKAAKAPSCGGAPILAIRLTVLDDFISWFCSSGELV